MFLPKTKQPGKINGAVSRDAVANYLSPQTQMMTP
jgi:hypothetical protein